MPDKKIDKVVCYWHITRSHDVSLDAVEVYKIHHTLFTDESSHSEYGGYGGHWEPFEGMQLLVPHAGTLTIPGREWVNCQGDAWETYMKWMDAHA